MKEPILVIMAAGMGSRYGGLKQMDPVGENGELIIDYSLYDAYQAGFRRVNFILKKENEELFRRMIGDKIAKRMEVTYVFQSLETMPAGFAIPEGRVKPWGTGHAVLCARDAADAPFAVINADDFYGREAFDQVYAFLKAVQSGGAYRYAMVGYPLENTLSEKGSVARGICELDEEGRLLSITERTHIIKTIEGPLYTEDRQTYYRLPEKSVASMNLFGFHSDIFRELDLEFKEFLKDTMPRNPLSAEFYLPVVAGNLPKRGIAQVKVLHSSGHWYGVTYREDRETVIGALRRMTAQGQYPEQLWA
jgi:NDP-sugar pyrophosphorylase family protein